MSVIRAGILMTVCKRSYEIAFQLNIQVVDPSHINGFYPCLHAVFIAPPAIIITDMSQTELIQDQLAVDFISFEEGITNIQTHEYIVGTAEKLLHASVQNHRIEVLQFKLLGPAEKNRFKKTHLHTLHDPVAKVMRCHVFFFQPKHRLAQHLRWSGQFCKNILIMKFPDIGIERRNE